MGKTNKQYMIGKKYGILTVLSEIQTRNKNGHILYNVKCDCGKEKQILGASLRSGASRSCNKCSLLTGSHGMWKSKEFSIWGSMKDRCYNKNNPRYKNYGERGIRVCDNWIASFKNFYNDMGKKPSELYSLDRINNNGNYCKDNCRWVTAKVQAKNRSNNKIFTFNNKTLCASDWCELLNMSSSTFYNRLNRGWSIEKTINTPVNKRFVKDEK